MAENSKIIWDYLKNKGLNDYAVAGIMGNLEAESGLVPTNLQNSYEKSLGYTDGTYTTAVDNGKYKNFVKDSAGYGLAQWTYYTRKQGLLNLAQKQKKSIGNINMQLDYLWQELNSSFKNKVLIPLKSATSVKTASDIVLTKFESPRDQSNSIKTARANRGLKYYNKYKGTSTSESQTTEQATQKNASTDNTKKNIIIFCAVALVVILAVFYIKHYKQKIKIKMYEK